MQFPFIAKWFPDNFTYISLPWNRILSIGEQAVLWGLFDAIMHLISQVDAELPETKIEGEKP